jgi:magnesium transporter
VGDLLIPQDKKHITPPVFFSSLIPAKLLRDSLAGVFLTPVLSYTRFMYPSYNRSQKTGMVPGTLVYTGEETHAPVTISVIEFDEKQAEFFETLSVEKALEIVDDDHIDWLNVNGVHDIGVIEKISEAFGLHPLTREDIASVGQRPKVEFYDEYVFIVLRMLNLDLENDEIIDEQVSFVLCENNLVSFQERDDGDVFEVIRERLRTGKGRVRRMKADYLVYALIDVIVDHYFVILEHLGEKIEALEDELAENPNKDILLRINRYKRMIIFLRRSVWPLREVLNAFQRENPAQFSPAVVTFMRDVYDHTIQVIDTLEAYRDLLTGMLDVYMTSLSNKTNQIMKVLTIISTIFIPLTFIAGVYGMNFEYMPELSWKWGYPLVWAVMLSVVIGLIAYFRHNDWW